MLAQPPLLAPLGDLVVGRQVSVEVSPLMKLEYHGLTLAVLVETGLQIRVGLLDSSFLEGPATLLAFRVALVRNALTLLADEESRVIKHTVLSMESFTQVIETCSGLGALGKGAKEAGFVTCVHNDIQPAVCTFLQTCSHAPVVLGDISQPDTVFRIWREAPSAAIIAAGVSCQPYSRLGDGHGFRDSRAQSLHGTLQAAIWLKLPVIVIECVSEAWQFEEFRSLIEGFCKKFRYTCAHTVLDLKDVWVARRRRWWGILTSIGLGQVCLPAWCPSGQFHAIGDLFETFSPCDDPYGRQLHLSLYELRTFDDFGPILRFVPNMAQNLPTAMHSWGSQLLPCKCGCRSSGLALERFAQKGLHAVLIPVRGTTHHAGRILQHMRHLSGPEVALLNGLLPSFDWGPDARLGLALVGQLASPLQSAWIFSHLAEHLWTLDLLPTPAAAPLVLLDAMRDQLVEAAVVWGFRAPSAALPAASHDTDFEESDTATVPYQSQETISAPFSAEDRIGSVIECQVVCDGVFVPVVVQCGQTVRDLLSAELGLASYRTQVTVKDAAGLRLDLDSELINDQIVCIEHHVGPDVEDPYWDQYSLMNQVLPEARTTDDVTALRFAQAYQVQQRLQSLAVSTHVWADDELAFHLQAIAALTPGFEAIDPLLASSCCQQGRPADDYWHFEFSHPELPSFVGTTICIDGHWVPWLAIIGSDCFEVCVGDVACSHLRRVRPLTSSLGRTLGLPCRQVCQFVGPWNPSPSCGGNAILQLGLWVGCFKAESTLLQSARIQAMHDEFVEAARNTDTPSKPLVFGAGQFPTLEESIVHLLVAKGVNETCAANRVQAGLERIGRQKLSKAMNHVYPWTQLKTLGNQCHPPLRWISQDELAHKIEDKVLSGQPIGNRPGRKKQKGRGGHQQMSLAFPVVPPDQLQIQTGTFVGRAKESDPWTQLSQITLSGFSPTASGVAITSCELAKPYLTGPVVSSGALGLLVVGAASDTMLPTGASPVRFPATRTGGGEPLLVSATLLQLGKIPVVKFVRADSSSVTVEKSRVLRITVYRDELLLQWHEFVDRPVKEVIALLPPLNVCLAQTCSCDKWHKGSSTLDSPLLDVWGRSFKADSLKQCSSVDATVFAAYFRVADVSGEALLRISGHGGIYVEPRCDDTRQPDSSYQVIWLHKLKKEEVLIKCQSNPDVVGLARLGLRYGLRVSTDKAESVHKAIKPGEVFIGNVGRCTYHVGPFPFGTQRNAISKALAAMGWQIRPIQVVQSGFQCHGVHWAVQANCEPPQAVFQMQHGDVMATLVPEADRPPAVTPPIVAAKGTIAKLIAQKEVEVDPLIANDPWAKFSTRTKPPAAQAFDVPQMVAQVKREVLQSLPTAPQQSTDVTMQDPPDDARIVALETKVQELAASQCSFQKWTQSQLKDTHTGIQTIHRQLQDQQKDTQSMFEDQMKKIESLLNKRQRTENDL